MATTKEIVEFNIIKLCFKSLYNAVFATYLKLNFAPSKRNLGITTDPVSPDNLPDEHYKVSASRVELIFKDLLRAKKIKLNYYGRIGVLIGGLMCGIDYCRYFRSEYKNRIPLSFLDSTSIRY